ncbi:hypothetical protein PYCCODRAFT_299111 [Trametes coccinea BRFM310]|uniref:Uncharacterized protein n=1 Tax=Trametes coccinea (strain BRFM310) TaxID=1353009 RepID=A0A1Y2INN9_TRAC3|nr:hypothetical protein PYCCODRAFT_299111 [Trametes coccinea BRFM310]
MIRLHTVINRATQHHPPTQHFPCQLGIMGASLPPKSAYLPSSIFAIHPARCSLHARTYLKLIHSTKRFPFASEMPLQCTHMNSACTGRPSSSVQPHPCPTLDSRRQTKSMPSNPRQRCRGPALET